MSRKPNPDLQPREHIFRQRRPNGDTYVIRRVSVYDPSTHRRKTLENELLGKIPKGKTEMSDMIPTDKTTSNKKQADTLTRITSNLTDTRRQECVIYKLDLVLFVVILAGLAGYKSSYEIAQYWKANRELLKQWFSDFPDRDIAHDTVSRLISIIGKHHEQDLLDRFTKPLLSELQRRVIAVDGQSVRASKQRNEPARYVLNFFDADNEMCIRQKLIGPKENEITHAASTIREVDITGAVVTCDALNSQKAFAQAIIDKGADYCLAIKDNQKKLLADIKDWFGNCGNKALKHTESVNYGHGRIEKREVFVLPSNFNPLTQENIAQWAGLDMGCVVMATTERTDVISGEKSKEVRYYITSLLYDEVYIAAKLQHIIRQHWAVENKLHWVLDVTFSQDRTQCKNAEFLRGRTLLTKVVFNLISKMQTLSEQKTARQAISKPAMMVQLASPERSIPALIELFKN